MAVRTAMAMLVMVMIVVPLRIEIQGSMGKDCDDFDFFPACNFFLFATTRSGEN